MWNVIYLLIVILTFCHANLEKLLEDIDEGRTWNLKVEVAAGDLDCYYERILPGEIVSIEFDTVSSTDSLNYSWDMTFTLTNEDTGEQLERTEGLTGDFYDDSQVNSTSDKGAIYKFCLDNSLDDNFKHVVFHFSAHRPGWGRYAKEIEQLDVQSSLFILAIQRIDENIRESSKLIYHSGAKDSRGYNVVAVQNERIMFWSTISCIWIIGAGLMQVYFIKSLFDNTRNGRLRPR